ncbi:RING/U-box superfamily protein [Prunus dulcis]|uniref:RING-type E3 ubiquitin transferase n=1 Tax=Prunus dulcis TaxID=3755 RepID=A0A4Y1RZF4_PRUDU|nr:RING/U-box superfamily protein [Prunus dulcis]
MQAQLAESQTAAMKFEGGDKSTAKAAAAQRRIFTCISASDLHHHLFCNFFIWDAYARVSSILSDHRSVIVMALLWLYYSTRRRSQPQQQPLSDSEETHDDYIDEDHGPVLDHPIWYINTIGLQQSIISSITVCQYKRGNGLVEGTECSVCLSEFQEDETLRLLPKCNHAFHVPCIDTWLGSHTNCPMCRAPIVQPLATPAPEPNLAVSSIPEEETQVEISENIGESSEEMGEEICEIRIETEENREVIGKERDEIPIEEVNGLVEPRRSVSMDCLSASKISLELSNLPAVESERNSNTKLVAVNKLNREIVPRKTGGNQKLQRQKGSSSKGRSLQNVPLTMKRSSSCNGKVLFCRDVQNRKIWYPAEEIEHLTCNYKPAIVLARTTNTTPRIYAFVDSFHDKQQSIQFLALRMPCPSITCCILSVSQIFKISSLALVHMGLMYFETKLGLISKLSNSK